MGLVIGLIALLLRYAYVNHRMTTVAMRQALPQLAAIVVYLAAGQLLLTLLAVGF